MIRTNFFALACVVATTVALQLSSQATLPTFDAPTYYENFSQSDAESL